MVFAVSHTPFLAYPEQKNLPKSICWTQLPFDLEPHLHIKANHLQENPFFGTGILDILPAY